MTHTRSRLLLPLLFPLVLGLAACNGNRDTLLANLQSRRPEERAKAVKRLARQGRAEDLVLFTQAAKDVSALVRAEAASALARSQDARVVDLLGELLEDPDETVQAQAAMALAGVKDGKAKTYLTQQYGRRSRSTRLAILQALKESGVRGAMNEVVAAESAALWESHLKALDDGTLPERVGAAEALGRSGRPEAFARLLPLIRDSQVVLAAAAVRGLGEAGDPNAALPVAALLRESFPELRQAASTTLARLKAPATLPALVGVALERSPASAQATSAVLALPRTPESDAALCTIVLDGAPRDALVAGRAMRTRGGCSQERLLERLARVRDPLSGLQAVEALGPAAREALPRVLPLLQSPEAGVRLAALEAVAAVGDRAAAPAVQKVLESELVALAPQRADWVKPDGKPGAPTQDGAVGMPGELIDDVPPEQLRLPAAALRALGAVQAEGALAVLSRHADDALPALRTAAYVGLARLGPQGHALAARGLEEGEESARVQVAEALAAHGPEGRRRVAEAAGRQSEEQPTEGRGLLLEVLLETGVPADAAPALEPLLAHGGMEAAMAAHLLGEADARASVPALLRMLEDPRGGARREVLRALGQLGDEKVAQAVARELCHDLPEVRAAAAEALGRVGTAEQREALAALQGDYYRRVREAATAALAQLDARTTTAHGAR